MTVSLEPFDRFWCFNFWVKALDVYFHSSTTAGPSDPYNRRNTAAAASYGQHCIMLKHRQAQKLVTDLFLFYKGLYYRNTVLAPNIMRHLLINVAILGNYRIMFVQTFTCITYLITNITYQASAMGDDVIVKKCLELVDANGKETLESESFVGLRQETVKTVICRDTLDVPTEVDVWNACVKWAEAECKRQGKSVSVCCLHEYTNSFSSDFMGYYLLFHSIFRLKYSLI